jgi:Fe-S cluster assembly protein SufD
MSAAAQSSTERIAADFASAARELPASGPGAARRQAALDQLLRVGLPGNRDENWKYANLRPLERQRFVPADTAAPAALALPATIEGFARCVFVDGRFDPRSSDPLPPGVTRLAQLADAAPPTHHGRDERFALLNTAFATDGAAVQVDAATGPVRLEVLFVASAPASLGASYPALRVELAPDASLELIERHLSAGEEPSFITSLVSIAMAERAQLTHYRLQELNPRSVHYDTLTAQLGAQAHYRLQAVSLGAQAARTTISVRLTGERATLELNLASLGDRSQVQDTYAVVEHVAANARTTQLFRGIAAGRARVACNGKIVVAKNAHGTDSRQSLRGLLAGPEAEIDVRPQLEIYTDDVRCSHGATAGKLDEQMLFYLLSRGLDRVSAQRLLKWAFLEDVIAQTAHPALRRQIEERLMAHLQDDALRELL